MSILEGQRRDVIAKFAPTHEPEMTVVPGDELRRPMWLLLTTENYAIQNFRSDSVYI